MDVSAIRERWKESELYVAQRDMNILLRYIDELEARIQALGGNRKGKEE